MRILFVMDFDPEVYLSLNQDVQRWINDGKQAGKNTGNEYKNAYGIDTTGWEDHWLGGLNKRYGRNEDDMSKYSDADMARYHMENWGTNEGRLNNEEYKRRIESNRATYVPWDSRNTSKSGEQSSRYQPFEDVLNGTYQKWDARYGAKK